MLTSDQLDALVEPVLALYEDYQQSVIRDIARRLAGLDYARPTAAWQMQRLSESGKVYEGILDELAKLTGKSEPVLRAMFEKAGVKAMRFDDSIYQAAGLNPLPLNLSPAMAQVLAAGLQKTGGVVKNLTMTTALDGQQAFLNAADLAYMQVTSGAMSYTEAIVAGVKKVAADGLSVIQFPGRKDQLDVAIRRTLLTGVNQTVGQLQVTRADELGQDLVAVSAHIGARNTGAGPANHANWQGKVYSRSGASRGYQPFVETTGYGTGPGLMGWNCRHSFYPFFEGISENAYSKAELESYATKTVKYNGEELSVYEATQKQRAIERKIRYWKRQEEALKAAKKDASQQTAKVRQWQGEMRSFTKQTGLMRQSERERVISLTSKTKNIEKVKKIDLHSDDNYSLGLSKDVRTTYPENVPGRNYCRSADTQISKFFKSHVLKDHPERIDWITTHPREIASTIQNPQIIEAYPWKRNNGHWSQTFVQELPEEDGFVVIALSLANLPGEPESDFHQVTSIYFAKNRNSFYDKAGNLKKRWLLVK